MQYSSRAAVVKFRVRLTVRKHSSWWSFIRKKLLLLVCIGGLESDENCHTFDADRNVIPGLYVAGNVQGNRFATEYPIGLKGVSHSMAMYYGYVAGKNAMQEI